MSEVETLKRRWEREDRLNVDNAIAALFSDGGGRKFLWWLLELGKVGGQPFTGGAETTAFNCGELNVGNQILARLIEVSPEGYITSMKENANATRDRDTELGAASDIDAGNRNDSFASERDYGDGRSEN